MKTFIFLFLTIIFAIYILGATLRQREIEKRIELMFQPCEAYRDWSVGEVPVRCFRNYNLIYMPSDSD